MSLHYCVLIKENNLVMVVSQRTTSVFSGPGMQIITDRLLNKAFDAYDRYYKMKIDKISVKGQSRVCNK